MCFLLHVTPADMLGDSKSQPLQGATNEHTVCFFWCSGSLKWDLEPSSEGLPRRCQNRPQLHALVHHRPDYPSGRRGEGTWGNFKRAQWLFLLNLKGLEAIF